MRGGVDVDDGIDMDRVTQRVVPARGATPPATTAASSVFNIAKPAKRERVTAPAFDPKAIAIKRVPMPGPRTGVAPEQAARYQALLDRMKPGDCVELVPIIARGLQSHAKKVKTQVALRKLGEDLVGVWRVK